jgi:hypothetical protein
MKDESYLWVNERRSDVSVLMQEEAILVCQCNNQQFLWFDGRRTHACGFQ